MYQTPQYQSNSGCNSCNYPPRNISGLECLAYNSPSSSCTYQTPGNTFYSECARDSSSNIISQPNIGTPSTFNYNHSKQLSYELFQIRPNYEFIPDDFLKPGKEGLFVGKAEEIRTYIEQTFEQMFATHFPEDIKISVLNLEQFRKLAPSSATVGLSINRRRYGLLSEIFVLNDTLGKVMLTIGHELGHVLTSTQTNHLEEEAKAYAFSLAWMKTIKENNIAGLKETIILNSPAENGLHNIAFRFVKQLVDQGKQAFDIYQEIIQNIITVDNNLIN